MKRLLVGALLAMSAMAASAACFGSGSLQTCTDASGNSYTVNRMGNTTTVNGYNPSTGSTWNQTSTTMGNTTIHNGVASNGNSWSGSSTSMGNTTIHNGVDSRGNPYTATCIKGYGCN